MESAKIRTFVIGPIGDRDGDVGSEPRSIYEDAISVFEDIIAPACDALGLEPFRADQISRNGEINEQIFRHLRDSHIVIADLTSANPNVMYELGMRHTTGKLTVQIGERGRLPFDISSIRTTLFKRSESGFVSARRALIASLADGLENGADPVTATRVWLENPDIPVASDEDIDAEGEGGEALGYLEQLANMELGLADLTQTTERGSTILNEVTQIIRQGSERIQNLPQSHNYSAAKLSAANQVAQELREPALRLNVLAQDFRNHVARTTPGVEHILREIGKHAGEFDEAPDFLEAVYTIADAARQSSENSESFAKTLNESGTATRLMKQVTDSIARSVRSISTSSKQVAAWKLLADKAKGNIEPEEG